MREPASFTIEAIDATTGQRLTHGGEQLFVCVRGVAPVRARVVDLEDGTYSVNWHPPQSGKYSFVISHFGSVLPGCPFACFATTPEPSAQHSTVRGDALHTAHSQRIHTFEVSFRDRMGATTRAVDLDVFVEPAPLGSPRARYDESSTRLAAQSRLPGPIPEDTAAAPKVGGGEQRSSHAGASVGASAGASVGGERQPSRRRTPAAQAQQLQEALGGVRRRGSANRMVEPHAQATSGAPAAAAAVASGAAGASSSSNPQQHMRRRRIRIRVGERPLVVRAGMALDSPLLGQLLPGTIVTVVEERFLPGHVRACVALDRFDKEMSLGVRTSRGAAFRSASTQLTHRTDGTKEPTPPRPRDVIRSVIEGGSELSSNAASYRSLGTLVELSYRSDMPSWRIPTPQQSDRDSQLSIHNTPQPSDRRIAQSSFRAGQRTDHGYAPQASHRTPQQSDRSAPKYRTPQQSERGQVSHRRRAQQQPHAEPMATPLSNESLISAGGAAAKDTSPCIAAPVEDDQPPEPSRDGEAPDASMAADAPSAESPAPSPSHKSPGRQLAESMRLPTDRVNEGQWAYATPHAAAARDGMRGSGFNAIAEDNDEAFGDEPLTGWVTLKKGGVKLVSSRLRLDTITRQQYQRQWERKVQHDKHLEREAQAIAENTGIGTGGWVGGGAASSGNGTNGGAAAVIGPSVPVDVGDREVDTSLFAFGGVMPGVLHAHGRMYEQHKVTYSIGVAGTYLLHVRLRHMAASLPGSPFLLTVHPAEAHASQTQLAAEIHGEISGECACVVDTGDLLANRCVRGGAEIVCYCGDDKGWRERTASEAAAASRAADKKKGDELHEPDDRLPTAVCVDNNDGTYRITWHSTRAGNFRACVRINGMHVAGSPTRLILTSNQPDVARCVVSGDGLRQVIKAETGIIRIDFYDKYGNRTIQTPQFRKEFESTIRMKLTSPGTNSGPSLEACHDFQGSWAAPELSPGDADAAEYASYELSYLGGQPGPFQLHLFQEGESMPERRILPGSPFNISIHANAGEQVGDVSSKAVDHKGILPRDYQVKRSVFEDGQKRWGECTVDAFASAATALLPRFWTESPMAEAEATDALQQEWKAGEVIWAHPPSDLLPELVALLENPSRLAEVIVVAPFRPTTQWAWRLAALADDKLKYPMGGMLTKVGDDAPQRVQEWPITLFHIPARTGSQGLMPIERLPKSMRRGHAEHWSPGFFTTGGWQAPAQLREGIQRAARQVRSAARIALGLAMWRQRAASHRSADGPRAVIQMAARSNARRASAAHAGQGTHHRTSEAAPSSRRSKVKSIKPYIRHNKCRAYGL